MAGVRLLPLQGNDPSELGPYRLVARLASGGMGQVYVARPGDGDDAGAVVAVKTLLAEGTVSDADRRRFDREVRVARRVDSPLTARVLDADPDADRPWMAIEYIAAPSLAELVGEQGTLPNHSVFWVGAGIAQALMDLHEVQIVHRDVKPSNVLLPSVGPRVIDFGISQAFDITRTSATLGTIAFTAPEQARGEETTSASDVYSLGATLFFLAVGRPPYASSGDLWRLLPQVQQCRLDLDGLPKGLGKLIRGCLAAKPERRPVPEEVMQLCLDKADRTGDGPWLPAAWAQVIAEYEATGRALREAGSETETLDVRTRSVPQPKTTRLYSHMVEAGESVLRRAEDEIRRVQDEVNARAAALRDKRREERRRAEEQRER
ncbi:MAG: serine/threonine protein kinase, partial [Streptomycetaceae bacterium]|nr:serine/threonine protein kinase [Streptomycetaceae bacterium]